MTAPSVPGSLEKGERAPLLLGLEQLAQRERGWGEGCECEKCRHLFINNTAHPLPDPPPLRASPCRRGGCLNCQLPLVAEGVARAHDEVLRAGDAA